MIYHWLKFELWKIRQIDSTNIEPAPHHICWHKSLMQSTNWGVKRKSSEIEVFPRAFSFDEDIHGLQPCWRIQARSPFVRRFGVEGQQRPRFMKWKVWKSGDSGQIWAVVGRGQIVCSKRFINVGLQFTKVVWLLVEDLVQYRCSLVCIVSIHRQILSISTSNSVSS